jgi:hypothetical protein
MSDVQKSVALSIVIPAKNESAAIAEVVGAARSEYPEAEIIVVDDGSTDATATVAEKAGAEVISHPESLGNGASVKSGARAARGETLVFMDGDGQHDPRDIARLLEKLDQGFDMAVGARDSSSQASIARLFANGTYNLLASKLSGREIKDLTSGFRAVRAPLFKKFLYLLPNGFSYPTTITMAFLRSGYPVCYEPVEVARRNGNSSHIRPVHDGVRLDFPADKRCLFHDGCRLLCLYLLCIRSFHEHEPARSQRLSHHFPDRPDFGTDHCPDLQQVLKMRECVFVIGTRAQLVKVAPVLNCACESGLKHVVWFTGQHLESIDDLVNDFCV